MNKNNKKFSIILPIYGNEENLPVTIPYIIERLNLFPNYDIEIIMVCDGSPDNSYDIMKEYQEKYPQLIKIAKFTRNYGQGAAVNCGISLAEGDVLGIISADLQDPFELFVDMLKYWECGYKLVIGTRKKRPEKGFSGWCSKTLHKLIHNFVNASYPKGGFDFYLMDKEVGEAFIKVDAANGATQLQLLWFGYKYKLIEYERRERKIGKSGYTLKKRLNATTNFIITYSNMPLRLFFIPAMIEGILSVIFLILAIIGTLKGLYNLLTIGTLLFFISLFSSIILLAAVILGEYLWRIQDRVRNLPRYTLEEVRDEINKSK